MSAVTATDAGVQAIPAGWTSFTIQNLAAVRVAAGYGSAPTFAGGVILEAGGVLYEDTLSNDTPAIYIQTDTSVTAATRCIYR
jgi:hypothetical protein